MVDSICKEIAIRKTYLTDEVTSIYFGGGTPSVLYGSHLGQLLNEIYKHFTISPKPEITLEANPDDLQQDQLRLIYKSGINRLSIGFQSFDENVLKWMNRSHTNEQSLESMQHARAVGFENISVDLIYAIPGKGLDDYRKELTHLLDLDPDHVSIYGLTIEKRTVFDKWVKDQKLIPISDDLAADEYLLISELLQQANYEHYEVSNYAKKGYYSRHNSSYWNGSAYLGVGPGAHSFNHDSRQMNIRNNPQYIKRISAGEDYFEVEKLSEVKKMNESILTSLRSRQGLNLSQLLSRYGINLLETHRDYIDSLINHNMAELSNQNVLTLNTNGFLNCDTIALAFFANE
jgi:oxygen-independent coproporphyrinogen-3 oxidase